MRSNLAPIGLTVVIAATVWTPRSQAAGAAPATPTMALLEPEIPPSLGADLPTRVAAALVRRARVRVVGARRLRARLRSAPAVREALASGRRRLARAEQALLHMSRAAAVAQARQAIADFVAVGAQHFESRLLASAYMALARALLLKPADRSAASDAIVAARQLQPTLSLERAPSRLRRLAPPAGERRPASASAEMITLLRELADVDLLVWWSVELRGSDLRLRTRVVGGLAAAPQGSQMSATASAAEIADEIARLVLLSLPEQLPTSAVSAAPGATSGRPWHSRWWVWTIGGIAVASAVATAVVIGTREEREPGFRVRVSGF